MPTRRSHAAASAAFAGGGEVEQVLRQLLESGVPRDLIEVATDPATAKRDFTIRPGDKFYAVLAAAGRWSLAGLLISIALSLILVLLVPIGYAGPLSIVQMLGPNVGALGGAVLGGLWGLFRPRPLADYYCRVRQTGGILVIVHAKTAADAEQILARLTALGGREGQVATVA